MFAWKALEDTMAREEKSNVINRDMNKDEKLKALDAALTQIEKAYGKGSILDIMIISTAGKVNNKTDWRCHYE